MGKAFGVLSMLGLAVGLDHFCNAFLDMYLRQAIELRVAYYYYYYYYYYYMCLLFMLHFHYQGRVANPRPVAKIKTGLVSQPITDAADATGRDRSWNATRPELQHTGDTPTPAHFKINVRLMPWLHVKLDSLR